MSTARRVLEAIVFADLLDRPLTILEIARLVPDASVGEIDRILTADLSTRVAALGGFFVLRSSIPLRAPEGGVAILRKSREPIGDRKLQVARQAARWFCHIPGVRAIAVCNSASWRGGKDESDIDFFIMTRPGFLWTVRFFAVVIAELFFTRPCPGRVRDALCLSFYATTEFANLQEIAIPSRDLYLEFWRTHLFPLYDPQRLLERFTTHGLSPRWEVGKSLVQPFFEVLSFYLEPFARAIQMRLFPRAIRELMNRDTRVVVNNRMLKLYTTDRRQELMEKFQEKIQPLRGSEATEAIPKVARA